MMCVSMGVLFRRLLRGDWEDWYLSSASFGRGNFLGLFSFYYSC
jgi:hypothetical protein